MTRMSEEDTRRRIAGPARRPRVPARAACLSGLAGPTPPDLQSPAGPAGEGR